jgi:hypothetical protein
VHGVVTPWRYAADGGKRGLGVVGVELQRSARHAEPVVEDDVAVLELDVSPVADRKPGGQSTHQFPDTLTVPGGLQPNDARQR